MRRGAPSRRGAPDSVPPPTQQPERAGWIRKFCGRGMFRDLWRNRFVVLRGERLYISEKEVKAELRAQEVLDLADFERSEELRKTKSRSKKNHSRFTLLQRHPQGSTVPKLVFLAVSPEEKELWVNAINAAIIRAKNRVLDEVALEDDSTLGHPTRDRAKVPQGRRLPSRGHLLAVASTSSQGTLTFDLVSEEDSPWGSWETRAGWSCDHGGGVRQRAETDASRLRALTTPLELRTKTSSLGRQHHHLETKTSSSQVEVLLSRTPQPGKRLSARGGRSRCASMDEVLSCRPAMIRSQLRSALRRCPTEEGAGPAGGRAPVLEGSAGGGAQVGQLQSLIAQRMQRAQELLEEMRLQELQKSRAERETGGGGGGGGSPHRKKLDSPRLQQLRSSSRGSGSTRSDSPRLRGRGSPRTKANRSRAKGAESPRGRGAESPRARGAESPALSREAPPPRSPEPPGSASTPKPVPEEGGRRSSEEVRKVPSTSSSDLVAQPPAAGEGAEPEAATTRAEAERLLQEALSSWKEAQEVLQEVKELQSQTLRRQRRRTYEKMTSQEVKRSGGGAQEEVSGSEGGAQEEVSGAGGGSQEEVSGAGGGSQEEVSLLEGGAPEEETTTSPEEELEP